MPKPTAPPRAAMRIPVTEGPTMRPACQGMEPRAMALGRRSRSTSCGTSAMRLGSSGRRERNAAGLVEGAEAVAQRGEGEEDREPRQAEHGEEERGAEHEGHQGLRRHEEPEPVDTIGEHAAAELEEDEGHALGEAEIGQ